MSLSSSNLFGKAQETTPSVDFNLLDSKPFVASSENDERIIEINAGVLSHINFDDIPTYEEKFKVAIKELGEYGVSEEAALKLIMNFMFEQTYEHRVSEPIMINAFALFIMLGASYTRNNRVTNKPKPQATPVKECIVSALIAVYHKGHFFGHSMLGRQELERYVIFGLSDYGLGELSKVDTDLPRL